ncbi:hypothetical protein K438DRAFT_1793587 [Mycena galopus ATCC 62051]|nr:hypothetical protein K438DRAFT_1793587 [Mycena galopus ATCC 62051]
MPPCLGVLGTREGDDWVGGWWRWWRNLQPEERLVVEGSGDIAREEEQPTKTSKRKAKRAVKENGADGGEPQSKRARKKTTAEPGAGESTTTRGRTRSSGTGLEGRPKPKPLYKGRNSVRLSEEALGDLHPKSLKSFGETLGDLRPTIPRPLVR